MPRHLYGAHLLQSPRTRVLMVGLYDLSKKKGTSSRVLQFTNKLTSKELKVTVTRPLLANQ